MKFFCLLTSVKKMKSKEGDAPFFSHKSGAMQFAAIMCPDAFADMMSSAKIVGIHV